MCKSRAEIFGNEADSKKWKELKWKFFKLEKRAEEKLTLLEKRQKLYGNAQLPDIPSFQNRLSEILVKQPDLESEILFFQQVLRSVTGVNHSPVGLKEVERLRKLSSETRWCRLGTFR